MSCFTSVCNPACLPACLPPAPKTPNTRPQPSHRTVDIFPECRPEGGRCRCTGEVDGALAKSSEAPLRSCRWWGGGWGRRAGVCGLRPCTAQYNTVQHGTVQYNTAQCSTAQYSEHLCPCASVPLCCVLYNTVQYSIVQCSTVQYSTIQLIELRTIQKCAAHYSQYNKVLQII